MQRSINLVIAALALCLFVSAEPAARAEDLQAANVSRAALKVFAEVCLAKLNEQVAMDAWLGQHLFRQAMPQAAAKLSMGAPGRVWLSGESGLPLAVITRSEGILCQVMAPSADPDLVAQSFRETISALARPGQLDVRKDEDDEVMLGGERGRRVIFRVGRSPIVDGGYLFALSAAPPRPGAVALLITASRMSLVRAP